MVKLSFVLLLAAFLATTSSAQTYFKFAHVSDTHVGSSPTAVEDLRSTVRDINADTSLRFVVITGDITEFGADDELALVADSSGCCSLAFKGLPFALTMLARQFPGACSNAVI